MWKSFQFFAFLAGELNQNVVKFVGNITVIQPTSNIVEANNF